MNLGLAILLGVIAGLAYMSRRIGGDTQFERPIILAPIVGLILGDLSTGVVVGGTLELIFIGAAPIGGAVPPNTVMAAVLGTSFAILSGGGIETALLIAIPAAVVATAFELLAKGSCSFLVHRADRGAEDADTRAINTTFWIGNVIHFSAYAVPAFLALALGQSVVQALTDALSGRVNDGLSAAAALLPAVGFGILLTVLYVPKLFPLFLVGFALAAYTDFTVIGVALMAIATILVLQRATTPREDASAEPDFDSPSEPDFDNLPTGAAK